jgi:methylated-DNA-[protein]-cysteine S-methyltransferase
MEDSIKSGKLLDAMTFSQKVWAITSRVPKGKVVTYAQIARKLRTKGYRAVGNALNHNPYAPQVPCHRVVGSDGSLTGFAGGIPKKAALLKAEGVAMNGSRVDLRQSLAKI